MIKHLTITLCLLCGLCAPLFSQLDGVIDDPGDIMIVGFSIQGNDGVFNMLNDILLAKGVKA